MEQTKEKQKTIMVELIKEKFADDPLFLECSLASKTKEKLFPDFLGQLVEGVEYSAQDAARFVNRSDANIRYYLQNLPEYIGVVKTSSSYRMRYDGVYRIYLIFMYIKDLNKQLKDIKVKIGEEAQFIPKRKNVKGMNEDTLDTLLFGMHLREKATLEFTEKMFSRFMEKSKKEQELNHLYIEHNKELSQIEETIRRLIDRKLLLEGDLRRKRNSEKERLWLEKVRALENKRKKESNIIGRIFSPIIVEKSEVEAPTEEEIGASPIVRDLEADIQAIEEKLKEEMEKAANFSKDSTLSKKISTVKEELSVIEQEILENKEAFDAIGEQSGQALAYFQKKKGYEIDLPENVGERKHLLDE
ncbi:hypothetical protein MKZ02_23350 [Pseudobacillus sp. FSL P4-0506]|uniref:hypothetical protein n=1 Tax=unclassified Pseudobacillus TaxID=2619284 RepID=UPI0030FC4DAC